MYLMLLLLPVAVAAPAILRGEIPLDLRLPLTQPPWQDARPAAMSTDLPAAAHTHAMQTYPWYRFIRSAGENRFVPLWYPLEGVGLPFLAAWRPRALSPFSLPAYFLPLEYGIWCACLLKLVVAGWCMLRLARRLGLERPVAFCAALAYQWSAGVYGCFDAPLSDAVAWLPMLLLGLDGMVAKRPRAWVTAALAWGLMLLGGEPGILATSLLFGLLFLLLRSTPGVLRGSQWPLIRAGALWIVLGLALAGVQVIPFVEFLKLGSVDVASSQPLQIADLLCLFWPVRESTDGRLLFAGAPQWLLLALWLAVREYANPERRRTVDALLLCAGLLALLSLLQAHVSAVGASLGAFAPAFLTLGISPALALAAASAMPAWLGLDPDQVKAALARLLIFLLPLWGAGIVAAAVAFAQGHMSPHELTALVGTMILLFLVLTITLLRPRRHLMTSAVAVLTFATLLYGNRPTFQFTPADLVFPETQMTASLRELGGRVGGSATLRAWPLSGSGLSQTFATSGIRLDRYVDFVARAQADPRLFRRAAAQTLLFSRDDIQGEYAELRPHLRIEQVYSSGAVLFRDLEARSEARIAPQVRTIPAYQAGLLDADQPPLFEGTTPQPPESNATLAAEVVRGANPNEVVVTLKPEAGGVLVLADAHYPGWHARVGDSRVQVAAADGLFRGVRVGTGWREVKFLYRPRSVLIGALLSIGSLAILLIALSWPRTKPKPGWA